MDEENVVRISDAINSEESYVAASSKAVKTAYDLANSKSKINSATATVTNTVGTPSATVNVNNSTGVMSFSFTNIKGEKGDKPVKGTDYFTSADKTEIVNAVLAAMPAAEEASF